MPREQKYREGNGDNQKIPTQETSPEDGPIEQDQAFCGDEAIFYDDYLVEVSEVAMKVHPFKNIGLIEIITGGRSDGHGTGVLISPNLVLTCGHNIFNKSFPANEADLTKSHHAQKLNFYPGHRGALQNPYEV
jgi:V8-like Glu-specific endopeptidase